MKAKVSVILLLTIVLGLCILFGRTAWQVEAAKATVATNDIFNVTPNRTPSYDEAIKMMNQYRKELRTVQYLAATCVFVFECTPHQAFNAAKLAKLEITRTALSGEYFAIKERALDALLVSKDNAEFMAYEKPYNEAKKSLLDIESIELNFPGRNNLPPKLAHIFFD